MSEKTVITLNCAKCKLCHDIIISKSVHDMVWCSCRAVAVDGGNEYLKRAGNPDLRVELSRYKTIES